MHGQQIKGYQIGKVNLIIIVNNSITSPFLIYILYKFGRIFIRCSIPDETI